ncbi:MAG: flagellar assembly protein T N-terminal domain-containing protein [Glaciecola sp.]
MLTSLPIHAAWFSATGQAVVINGDRDHARKQATEEAIKQALLFAGASVRSVQQMTNGLLMDDHLEIRATGEVNTLQLIDEVYADGVVTVSIRADIFAQDNQCSAADYTKKISTTYFPIMYQAQAADGQVQKLGEATALKFKTLVQQLTPNMQISHIEPYVFDWQRTNVPLQAKSLANKTNTQYVATIILNDISVERYTPNGFNPFRGEDSIRSFNFTLNLINGATGEQLYSQNYDSAAPWDFAFTDAVDVSSQRFWRSQYGKHVQKMLQQSITDLEEFAVCQPTMGRVLAVANNQLQINLGRTHQVQVGDQLTLFNVKQITDTFGQEYRQFVLHPTSLVVRQVFSDTATVEAIDRSLLGNVQPNDYVARQ